MNPLKNPPKKHYSVLYSDAGTSSVTTFPPRRNYSVVPEAPMTNKTHQSSSTLVSPDSLVLLPIRILYSLFKFNVLIISRSCVVHSSSNGLKTFCLKETSLFSRRPLQRNFHFCVGNNTSAHVKNILKNVLKFFFT